jgi:hypothetical protein
MLQSDIPDEHRQQISVAARDLHADASLLVPLPYVDVSQSWQRQRGERILIAAAGMSAELVVAAIAVTVGSAAHDWLSARLARHSLLHQFSSF